MSARHHLSDCYRIRVVERLETDQNVTTVAAENQKSCFQNHAEGQGRKIVTLEDRHVALVAKRNRNFSPGRIASNLATVTGTHVSARVISRRLNQVGLLERKPFCCILL
ncbi:hypothetical protein TNCV_3110061 [Trichonephila clavipes]|nr:hypothetical protein TNCV_3110061 [Trichonephila clavipes]